MPPSSSTNPPQQPPTQLTPHFTLDEFTLSQEAARRGLVNEPDALAAFNLCRVAAVLEQVRDLLGGRPVVISSGYRSPAVNRLVGGAEDSAHLLGLAADFVVPSYGSPLAVCRHIAATGLLMAQVDQLIFEGTWVHLGLKPRGVPPRRQVVTATFNPGRDTTYSLGLPL